MNLKVRKRYVKAPKDNEYWGLGIEAQVKVIMRRNAISIKRQHKEYEKQRRYK